MTEAAPIFTIGHSNHALADFLALLEKHGVTAVADVRSQPVSRRNPHFNREELEPALRQLGTVYVFLGDQLGGRPGQPSLYDLDGRMAASTTTVCGPRISSSAAWSALTRPARSSQRS
jgi:hypothetical protein